MQTPAAISVLAVPGNWTTDLGPTLFNTRLWKGIRLCQCIHLSVICTKPKCTVSSDFLTSKRSNAPLEDDGLARPISRKHYTQACILLRFSGGSR